MNEMQIGEYTIANPEKWTRAVEGSLNREGRASGGVGENASDLEKLAAYDKLAGLIKKGERVVVTGSFYDFKKGEPRTEPDVKFLFRDLEGNTVEISEGETLPIEVQAAQAIAKKKSVKKVKKPVITDDEVE